MDPACQSDDTVAYIPARLGSERVPKKNLRHLGGYPLVTHVARTARQSSALDRVYVNTESSEIAAAAATTGVDIYMRDERLAVGPISTDNSLRFCPSYFMPDNRRHQSDRTIPDADHD